MKILVIDNGTSYLAKLENLLSPHIFRVIKYSEIDSPDIGHYDCAILSGGHDFPVVGHEPELKREMDFVKNCRQPIFGICFGFEIIARAFGANLELMANRERGLLDIQVIEADKIFLNIPNFQVFENHRWVIKEPIKEFITLARSKDGIEAIKHQSRPLYAVQFHPEMFVEQSCGDECFRNFLNSVK